MSSGSLEIIDGVRLAVSLIFRFQSLSLLSALAALVSPFPAPSQVAPPAAAPVWNIRAFGAVGDGDHLDNEAINRAIEAADGAGGGTVWIPAGTYSSYSIHLKSNITLYLDAGAVIEAAEPPEKGSSEGYDPPEPNPAADQYDDFGHTHWHNSLIWGENLHDVAIVGPGKIYGKGLSHGWEHAARDLLPEERRSGGKQPSKAADLLPNTITPGPFKYPNSEDTLPAGIGNKAIALKNSRNVTFRDFTILHGGHFAILVTGVDNLTIDNLKIDTNRDGIDIDASSNVRITNTSVNSPEDDAIVLKSSYSLGELRPTQNVTIDGCYVSGFDEGTMLDGTRQTGQTDNPTGRIKLGTESNGGFQNIAITNSVFEHSRGLALETVDGGTLEDIVVSNLVMRDIVSAPIFMRLGRRLRGPGELAPGKLRRVMISNVVASGVNKIHGIFLTGIPGFPIEDISLNHIRIHFAGGGTKEDAAARMPEREQGYPEPYMFGPTPAYGLFARHARGLKMHAISLTTELPDARAPIALDDVADVDMKEKY